MQFQSMTIVLASIYLLLCCQITSCWSFTSPWNNSPHGPLVTYFETKSRITSTTTTYGVRSFELKSSVKDDDWNITSSTIRGEEEDFEKIHDEEFIFRTKRWVIIVDDEESIRLAIGDYLFDQGYQVTACADADALLLVCSTPMSSSSKELPPIPDAIVSDVRMPGTDGLELVRVLRSQERLKRVPVILLTAKTLTQDRILGYKAGADAYLTKPFAPEELLVIIDTFIRRKIEMTGPNGKLLELRGDMINIKEILKQNSQKLIKETDVYLTPAEQEVLALLCKGYSNGEIAQERGNISIIGINRMIQKLYLKTQTRSRTELVRWAIQTCYVPRP